MSRGDEIQEDGPRRSRQPAPAPVRDRYDDDLDDREDIRHRARIEKLNRSGLVMSVGILGIVLGSLGLACGVCGGFTGTCMAGVVPIAHGELKRQAEFDPNAAQAAQEMEKAGTATWMLLAGSVLNLAVGSAMLLCSIGVLMRSNIARCGLVGVCALSIVVEFTDILAKLLLGLFADIPDAFLSVASLMVVTAFAGFAWIVLLIPRYADEFRR